MRIYLDHNATTPLDPRVRDAMDDAMHGAWANPSSPHAEGRAARAAVETARRAVAARIGGAADEVVFTSGGTEADAVGVIGLARLARAQGRPAVALAPATEHPAIAGALAVLANEGFDVREVPVDGAGVMDADALRGLCAQGAAVLALALANHELGTLQDVAAATQIARSTGILTHCDAVQAVGKQPVDVAALGVDSLALSAHKLYGPKGAGAAWLRRGLDVAPLVGAGHQERGRRPGTENVLGAVGLGCAARLAMEEGIAGHVRVRELRDWLESQLSSLDGARVHAATAPRIANTINIGFDGALGEVVATALDLAGIAVSTGAACTSGTVAPSPVLLAIAVPEQRAAEAIRFSLGLTTTQAELKVLLEVLPDILSRARHFR